MTAAAPSALDETLSALADPVRRGAVELLARGPLRAGELAAQLGTTPSAMSKHLRVLRRGGLVEDAHPEFDARVRVYSLRSAPMAELRQWLHLAEQGWASQLTALAEHIERTG